MGYGQKACLSWGFRVPEDKLYDLVLCLRKHSEKNQDGPGTQEAGPEVQAAEKQGEPSKEAPIPTPQDVAEQPGNETKPKPQPKKKKRKVLLDEALGEELDEYLMDYFTSRNDAFWHLLRGTCEDNNSEKHKKKATLAILYKTSYPNELGDGVEDGHVVDVWGTEGEPQPCPGTEYPS